MANIYGPILPLQLDSRNTDALIRAIQTRIFLESNGQLNDFSPASPLAAISEGQAFAHAELLYYLNNLPEAFSLQWLRQLGIQRRLGSRALADVTFYKSVGFQRVLLIPANTKVYSNSGRVFLTIEEVKIDENTYSVTIPCKSEKWGSVYNVGAGEINKIEKNFAGLESLSNNNAAVGGSDLESVDEMKLRAFEVLSRRNLTTSTDFENEVKTLAPESSVVKVLTYEERNQLSSAFSGNVVICVGDNVGKELSKSSLSLLINSMKSRITLGTNISFIPPDIIPLDVVISVYYDPKTLVNGTEFYANEIFTALRKLYDPTNLDLGDKLNYQDAIRVLYDLDFIQSINSLDVKLMVKDPSNLDGICSGFAGEESAEGDKCYYNYSSVLDSSSQEIEAKSPISTYKLYRAEIGLISSNDYSSLTFTFDNLYTP